MPAVTVPNPAGPAPGHRAPGRGRPAGRAGHHRAVGLRGRGVPGPARVRRRRPARPRPVRPHGPDGRGRVRAGRAQGHPVAPAPRLRDRHVHHRRGVPAPGLQRRRRPHHQRRHPVDDRRRRHPAHRGAAGGAGDERRPVPRLPALGQPAGQAQDDPAALPGHPGRPGRAADLGRRRRAAAGHRRRRSTGTPARASPTRRSRWCTPPSRPGAQLGCRGGPTSTRSGTCWRGRARSAPTGGRSAPASWRRSASASRSRSRPTPRSDGPVADVRHPAARRRADPGAGRGLRSVRDEHQGRAAAGVRGLPDGPARLRSRPRGRTRGHDEFSRPGVSAQARAS